MSKESRPKKAVRRRNPFDFTDGTDYYSGYGGLNWQSTGEVVSGGLTITLEVRG